MNGVEEFVLNEEVNWNCFEQLLKASATNPNEECVTVIQPGGGEGVNELPCSEEREGGVELGNITEVEEGSFANVVDVIFKSDLGIKLPPRLATGGQRGIISAGH